MMDLLAALTCAMVVTLGTTRAFVPLAIQLGIVDKPDNRKRHAGHVPLVGGLAIFVALCACIALFVPWDRFSLGLLGGATLIVCMGGGDDLARLGVKTRLLLQSGAALIMVWASGLTIETLGDLVGVGVIELGAFAVPFTVIAVVGVINAINMADGIDGLAGGITLVSLACLALAIGDVRSSEMMLIASLAAAVVTFMCFNLGLFGNAQKVFLGDAGSMLLGFVLCWLLIKSTQGTQPRFAPGTALWLLAVPLLDMWAVMGQRLFAGGSPFRASREHFHHLLLDAGFGARGALALVLVLAAALGGFALLADTNALAQPAMFGTFLALLCARLCLTRTSTLPVRARWFLLRLRHRFWRTVIKASNSAFVREQEDAS